MSYRIPLFDLNFGAEEEVAVLDTLRSRWITMGPRVEELETQFARSLGVTHAIALSSCTAALHLALVALRIKQGDEVIVPSLTFSATVNAIRYVGARPVFADIVGYDDFSIDPEDVASKLTSRTAAIMVMHYGGFVCDMDAIMDVGRGADVPIVEDAAHAPLSSYKGSMAGTMGQFGCFSFYANKNLTCAEGGMLVTNDRALAAIARPLRSHGMTSISYDRARGHATDYDVIELGYNYRLDDLRAAIALVQLQKLPADVERRSELRAHYLARLADEARIIIPYRHHPHRSANYIFPILLRDSTSDRRRSVRQRLAESGIQTSVHYPAVHRFSIYKDENASLPRTEYVADNMITLPLYHGLDEKGIDFICSELKTHLDIA